MGPSGATAGAVPTAAAVLGVEAGGACLLETLARVLPGGFCVGRAPDPYAASGAEGNCGDDRCADAGDSFDDGAPAGAAVDVSGLEVIAFTAL